LAENGFAKILVVKPSALGDIVHSLPFLNSIRTCFPKAEIHWVVAWGLHEFLEGHTMIDRLWVIRKDQWKNLRKGAETVREIKALFRDLRSERFDLVVDLQGLLRSGLITMSTRARKRVGFKEAREGSPLLYTHKVKGGRNVHAIERYLRVAEYLGCGTGVKYPFPPLPRRPKGLPGEYAVMAPSAGKEANRWPAGHFGKLASRLPIRSVIISGKSDAHIADEAVAASRGKAVSLAGKTTLKQMASVIRGARYFISNDTGPMHIAAAFGVPVFAIFGPANPARTGPYGDIHTIIRKDLDCAPCYRKKKCGNWKCMEELTVEEVLRTISKRAKHL
jgi:lipopolysaccharide heptosyltransferase I